MDFPDSPLFNYQTAPYVRGSETSREAAESIKPHVNTLWRKILDSISNSPTGLTCDEAERRLGISHQTCSARFRDLSSCQPPLIRKAVNPDGTMIKRPTKSGRNAQVFIVSRS